MIQLLLILVALQLFDTARAFTIQPKIVNGDISQFQQFPSYIYLQTIPSQREKGSACGGVLISTSWILTAAHCLEAKQDILIFGGIDQSGKFYGRERINVSDHHIHPKYDSYSGAYDIALARLPGPVPPSAFVRPALLPSDCGDNLANEIALVAGRGVISTDGSRDKRLRYATLKTLPRHVCYKTTNPISHPKSLICAVSIDDGKFAYNGDSGGPLIRQRDNALIGIASFVRKVDKAHIDGTDAKFVKSQAFQNVHFYFPWISRITGIKVPACPHPKPVTSKWGDVRLDRKRLEGFASLTSPDDFDSSDEESG